GRVRGDRPVARHALRRVLLGRVPARRSRRGRGQVRARERTAARTRLAEYADFHAVARRERLRAARHALALAARRLELHAREELVEDDAHLEQRERRAQAAARAAAEGDRRRFAALVGEQGARRDVDAGGQVEAGDRERR